MRRIRSLYVVFFIFAFSFFSFFLITDTYRYIPQKSIRRGEKIGFRVHYGPINAGEAIMTVDKKLYRLNGRTCYKIDVDGYTTGFFDLVLRVDDTWGTYMDTAALVSHRSYRFIEEGKYSLYEVVDFNHKGNYALLTNFDKNNREKIVKKDTFDIPPNVQDIVSAYYYLRTLDFDAFKSNEIFKLTGFFEDSTYTIDIKYLGKERVKTKLGKLDAYVISPIVPENTLFRGDNPVKAWISADDRKIPLKVEAELLVGALAIDVIQYQEGRKP